MLKVVIVDDEQLIRISIRKRIGWERLGLSVVGEADNGQAALSLLEEVKPDIVLVDIRMPVMNGLELIKEVRDRGVEDIQFIILSGYNDFQYMREAIKLGVCDYIQKPIDENELENTLALIIKRLETEHLNVERLQSIKHQAEAELASVQLVWLNQLVMGQQQRVRLISFEHPDFCLVLLYITGFAKDMNEEQINSQLHKKIKQVKGCSSLYFFRNESCSSELRLLINGIYIDKQDLKDCILSCAIEFKDRDIHLDAAISRVFNDISKTADIYEVAYYSLAGKIFSNTRPYISMDNLMKREEKQHSNMMHSTIRCLSDKLQKKDVEAAKVILLQIINKIIRPLQSIELLQKLLFELEALLHKEMPDNDEYSLCKINRRTYLLEFNSIEALYRDLFQYMGMCLCMDDFDKADTIRKAMSYINKNFHKDLTLIEIAFYCHMNPSYLSQLFKHKTGTTISRYIENVRIAKSKELLGILELPVVDVALRVGYNDANYFSKVFKKNTGVSPTQYQQMFEKSTIAL
jgi:two-component system, response regulator YesN